MRYQIGAAAVLAMAAGAMSMSAPAFAGFDEAHQNSFWGSQAPEGTTSHQGEYMKMDPRDAKVDPNAPTQNASDASNPYFNHAEGTMSGPATAEASTTTSDGRYTATYKQPYMQIEPRDQKVQSRDGAESNDAYFYHSMGTMGRP